MNRNNKDLYRMYEEEFNKNEKLKKENQKLKLDNNNLKYELDYLKSNYDKKVEKEIKKEKDKFNQELDKLKLELEKAKQEIDRLRSQVEEKNYLNDKLTSQVNKNSTNSSISTSKEIRKNNKEKTGANTYNYRTKSKRKSGGQPNHKGTTLTKEYIEELIRKNEVKVNKITKYINGKEGDPTKIKYQIGIEVNVIVDEITIIPTPTSNEKLPRELYGDVTYKNSVKALATTIGDYYCQSYSKTVEFIYDLTGGILKLSEGSLNNFYKDFSKKSEATINNITTNILNGSYQHTDETTTSQNGKESYYRAYANPSNVLYKYHERKGDKPIIEDGILNIYYGTIISDHEVGIFKYGKNNQDCIIHSGRYCNELIQNIENISWANSLLHLLFKTEINRKILTKFGKTSFTEDEINEIEKEYDDILDLAEKQNEQIESTYWKEKANTLLKRFRKHKAVTLFYIHDFSVPYDNNFIERALRMIKGKTKVSGGFRSQEGGIYFGNTMSIIKTAKLRKLNPFDCIKEVFEGKSLFA